MEHRLAALWLPPGVHVEPGEHPVETVRREAREELNIEAHPLDADKLPVFLTWTNTVGVDSHADISLWFLLQASADDALVWDSREFVSVRWWTPSEINNSAQSQFDPHMQRFLAKVDAIAAWGNN
ncbi:NUDIX domain protein [mine drainage metagenome]|uniref:NUDIX domain protein n=1 Tax=mine drainage metagenome TaxID=410659 RepID=A0A1J5PYH3_9ZZZZ